MDQYGFAVQLELEELLLGNLALCMYNCYDLSFGEHSSFHPSSLSVLLALSLKNVRHLSSGGSGAEMLKRSMRTANGLGGKLLKLKTTSSTRKFICVFYNITEI